MLRCMYQLACVILQEAILVCSLVAEKHLADVEVPDCGVPFVPDVVAVVAPVRLVSSLHGIMRQAVPLRRWQRCMGVSVIQIAVKRCYVAIPSNACSGHSNELCSYFRLRKTDWHS